MGHQNDYWENIRSYIIPKLGIITLALERVTGEPFYVRSKTHNNQFVGRVDMPIDEFEKALHDLDFKRNPLASLKNINDNEEAGSWRKVGYDNYPEWQLHAVLYDGNEIDSSYNDVTYVYAHWEYRWDVHPWKHYRAVDYQPQEGVKWMKDYLEQEGIVYDLIRP